MNRYLLLTLFCLLLFSGRIFAQARISASNQNYISVSSSKDQTIANTFQIQLDVLGFNRNYPDWSLGMILLQPITNSEGKTFPFSKLKLKLSAVNGTTFAQIGSGTVPVPISAPGVRSMMITSSNYPLSTGFFGFYDIIVFKVDLIIEGGTYMDALKSWQAYALNMAFVLLDRNGNELGRSSAVNGMQIRPDGSYQSPVSYGIQVQDNARSALLELKTMNDYANGASVSYANGLSVTAATPFAVQVRMGSANFSSGKNALPVSVANLNLSPSTGGTGGSIKLSETSQTILNGGSITGSSQVYRYNVRYFTTANDARLINAVPESYTGIVIYEVIPQ
ncbi:hypothetical protein [Pedobacter agri]|uniref:hypothetical protein n=1 Tax=Pedobacter agri TaxID=454586 RepID=UPI00292E855A|nr:hypothetical protein [Pedobacter agri]